jgi:hypothetical protein
LGLSRRFENLIHKWFAYVNSYEKAPLWNKENNNLLDVAMIMDAFE